jgi:hypothetical protein
MKKLSGMTPPLSGGEFKNIEEPRPPTFSYPPTEPITISNLEDVIGNNKEFTYSGGFDFKIEEPLRELFVNTLSGSRIAIDPAVEEDIWSREYERSKRALQDTKDNIAAEWSKRGFSLPNGVLSARLQEADLAYQEKRLDVSRDIAIKNAEMTNQNTMEAMKYSIDYLKESMNMVMFLKKWIWEAKLAIKQSQIALFEAYVKKYNADTAMYTALLNGRVDIAKAKAQIFAAEVEAYSAQVRAITQQIESRAKVFATQVDLYRAQVEAYAQKANLAMKVYDLRIQQAIAKTNIILKNQEMEIKNYEVISSLQIEAIRAAAQAAAQLLAGIMSAVSVGATLGARGETQTSTSTSTVYSHSYNEK